MFVVEVGEQLRGGQRIDDADLGFGEGRRDGVVKLKLGSRLFAICQPAHLAVEMKEKMLVKLGMDVQAVPTSHSQATRQGPPGRGPCCG